MRIIIIIIVALASVKTFADVYKVGTADNGYYMLVGKIELNTIGTLADHVKQGDTLMLNSNGGSVEGALKIAKLVVFKGLKVGIPADAVCSSACTIIFVASTKKYAYSRHQIKVHAPYHVQNGMKVLTDRTSPDAVAISSMAMVGNGLNLRVAMRFLSETYFHKGRVQPITQELYNMLRIETIKGGKL